MPSLARIANENPDQYRSMTVADRLAMLQSQLGEGGDIGPADASLLQLLRARREREAQLGAAAQQPVAPPGLLQRLFGAMQQANPFEQVSNQLQ